MVLDKLLLNLDFNEIQQFPTVVFMISNWFFIKYAYNSIKSFSLYFFVSVLILLISKVSQNRRNKLFSFVTFFVIGFMLFIPQTSSEIYRSFFYLILFWRVLYLFLIS